MKHTAMTFAFLGALCLGPNISAVHAQDGASACATPGSIVLEGIPTTRSEIVPSQQREIAGYGRAAKQGACKIALVCIAMDSGEAAREVARQQCVAVRDLLTASGFTKADITTARENPGGNKISGALYFTVQ